MGYQVLARKWRPQGFEGLVGQQHVVSGLKHALDQQQLHHAYLFSGTRGVGKTSLARIVAKCLNCEQGVSATPCGKCDSCLEIAQGRFPDLIEIDAASRTRVEDTRELLDNVQYAPTRGRYKVYLIDEVHMLSTHSFNALLKTLEEPPEHVKFLLATTDPQKLPVTVLSRCLQFHLKRIQPNDITAQLESILNQEAITVEATALPLIANAAQGSMRDALSLLDQAIAVGEGSVQLSTTQAMLGSISQQDIAAILQALMNKDAEALMQVSQAVAEQGADCALILSDLARAVFELSTYQQLGNCVNQILTKSQLAELSSGFAPEALQLFYDILVKGRDTLSLAPDVQVGFEMVLLRLLAFVPAGSSSQQVKPAQIQTQPKLEPKLQQQEAPKASLSEPEPVQQPRQQDTPAPAVPNSEIKKPEPVVEAPTKTSLVTELTAETWHPLCKQLPLAGMVKQLILNCEFVSYENQTLVLAIDTAHESMVNPRLVKQLQVALSQFLHHTVTVKINGDKTVEHTPAIAQKAARDAELEKAKTMMHEDKHVRFLQAEFDAIIEPESIQLVNERSES